MQSCVTTHKDSMHTVPRSNCDRIVIVCTSNSIASLLYLEKALREWMREWSPIIYG